MKLISLNLILFITVALSTKVYADEIAATPSVIDPFSAVSLRLTGLSADESIGTATGFIIVNKSKRYLVTNWHVVTGKDPNKNFAIMDKRGRIPSHISIRFSGRKLGSYVDKVEPLYENNKPRWIEDKVLGGRIDVIALPLTIPVVDNTISIYPVELFTKNAVLNNLLIEVTSTVFIIGYPYGYSASGLPIWKTGHIASEPQVGYNGLPCFLIDATTRSGMSGSPVVSKVNPGNYPMKDGNSVMVTGTGTKLLGIYSAQSTDHEIGVVWHPEVISDLLRQSGN